MTIEVSAERLARYVEELGRVGRNADGGLDRPVYSPAWAEARRRVAGWMEELGLEVRSDAVGNLFGRLVGTEPGVILTGSHIDTVPNGGALDGALGIHAALVAVGALARAAGPPRRSIEVVATCEEEGARFPARFWGARAMTGTIGPDEAETMTDDDGATIGAAMREHGLDPAGIAASRRTDVAAFLELHIEQGALLEEAGLDVGIVTAITGQYRARATVEGRTDHAGTTPMDLRRDAYLGGAEIALAIAGVAERLGRPAVATVGALRLEPGAINVVPGRATFTVDARHPEPALGRVLIDGIQAACRDVAERRGLRLDWETTMDELPQPMDAGLRALLGRCADDLGVRWMPLASGAGHDAQVMARAFPTAMVFVPSHDGRSHSPAEYTPVEQMVPGVRVLAEALRRLAYD